MQAQLRPSKVAHHIKKLSKLCGCCRQPYHTISSCEDPRIYELQLECNRQSIIMGSEIAFRYWLTHYS